MQLLANSIISGLVYALVGVGFSLIFSTVRFFHFTHGVLVTAGAYLTLLFAVRIGLPLAAAIPLAVVLCAGLGCLIEICVYRPLRAHGSSPLGLLLGSFGVYIVLQNAISLAFGDDAKAIRLGQITEGLLFVGARITGVQIVSVGVTLVLVLAVALLLKRSRLGRQMRAVANDAELARISGVESEWVILASFALGSALAAVAGILVALDVDMTPTMGMRLLMMGMVAVIVGGTQSIPGLVLGGVLLGIVQQLGVWTISSKWQEAIAFVVLLIVLIVRPQGLLGQGFGRRKRAAWGQDGTSGGKAKLAG